MLLSQSESADKRRKDQKLRSKFKGKKKHKRLDAICENAFNRSHRGVERFEQVEISNGGNQLEPRRSSRARKAPELLDSSPLPSKKRRKVDRSPPGRNTGRAKRLFSSASVLDEENGVWGSRLRSRGKGDSFSVRERGESSSKGKRKHDSDDYGDDLDRRSYDKKKDVAGEKSTVVKSKRPGRIKASNVLENGNQEFDLESEAEDDAEGSEDEALDVTHGLHSNINLEHGLKAEADSEYAHGLSQSDEEEEAAIQSTSDSEEEYLSNDTVELKTRHGRRKKLVCELVPDKVNSAEVNCAIDDKQQKDERPRSPLEHGDQHWPLEDGDQQKDEHPYQPLEDADQQKGECPHRPPEDADQQNDEHLRQHLEADGCSMGDDQQKDEHHIKPLEEDDYAMDDDQKKDEQAPRHPEVEDCAIDCDKQTVEPARRLLEEGRLRKSEGKSNAISFADRKPRIKLGRRCGLCGGGTDGKPPKILALEGAGSDNEAYTGSSASEEPNYDVLDGFGDQSGWLGRLLGPINDRFGIAGIWVHQQCAVWSPEVYFAGLGCLKNVRAALYRGRVLKCSRCRRPGATIGCRVDRCPKTYHLPCARTKGCLFDHRKFLIVCTDHRHLFQPHGMQNALRLKKIQAKRLKLELRKTANDASRKDIEAEEKWLENCGEDEEFLKRESKRLHRDLGRIAPTYIGGANDENGAQFQGWESVAGLQGVIQCMKEIVILPLLYPEFFNNLGITPPRGVLLHGHPGTGKTLVVRALVGSCARGDRRIAYFARKGADCLGKYVGDAERQLRLLFQVAEKSQPSIIFFDEIDGLAPSRSRRQDQTHNSVVSTLLALMDGLKSRGSVIVIGATNRPDAVDPALRRPGRFDREIYFPLPSVKDREAILSLHTQKWPKGLTGSLLKWVAKETVGFAGADLQALCTQAAMIALRRSFPLQEALLAAETRAGKSKTAIHTFCVEERDWLKALSCVPPPCSRRESGSALNDVVSSPLKPHLVPCLLQPLTRLLVCLHMDENVWLPPHLVKASALVKDVIISFLDCQRAQSDKWWLHLDGLLKKVEIMNEIEKNLMHANVLVGESSLPDFDPMDKNADEDFSQIPPSSQSVGARSGLLNKMSHGLCNKSGFHVLICGNPRSGQRHLASCLLHFFVGNVDVWKIDLGSISHEGHGDMVHGLTQILMGCTQANSCMLYMPTIDLWAIETDDIEPRGCEPTADNQQFSVNTYDLNCEVGIEHGVYPSADEEATQVQTAMKKESYLWTLFVEQVELMCVNSHLMILATSELPFSLLPSSIRHFFGNGIVNSGLSTSREHKVPKFSLQLDGEFDHDNVINSVAAKLSKDLAQHFVQSLHGENHIHTSSLEERTHKVVEDDVDQVCNSEAVHSASLNPVGLTNKTMKVKSSLLLAISSVGHQILSYPHFAELCWVTSKLKEGPYADINGPWKGWPFNSCIVRPVDSSQNVSDAHISGNLKPTKEPGLVRGLVAVGLAAYRGEYSSLREVCSEVRKVLETLVRRINEKVEAGKDKNQFIRILSQVAYLDDMVMSWAQALQSLEVDTRISEANHGSFVNHVVTKGSISEGHKLGDASLHQCEQLEKDPPEIDADGTNACQQAGNDTGAKANVSSDPINDGDPPEQPMSVDEVVAESVHDESAKLPNGFTERKSIVEPDGPLCHSSSEVPDRPNGRSDPGSNCGTKGINSSNRPVDICSYHCCSECFANLHKLIVRVIKMEWELQRGNSTVDDVHDFAAALSTNLHLSLHKLFQGGNGTDLPECKECSRHDDVISQCSFIFKDGVLSNLDQGTNVTYHCKFKKFCLDSLIEWLVTSKKT